MQQSINELCGLRVSVESYVPQRNHCNASAARASVTRSVTADTRPGASREGATTFPVGALHRGSSLSAVAAGATTRRTTGAVLIGRGRRRPMQSKRPSVSERAPPQATPPLRKLSGPGPMPRRWTWARGGITPSEGGVVKTTTTPPQIPIQNPLLNMSRKGPSSLK